MRVFGRLAKSAKAVDEEVAKYEKELAELTAIVPVLEKSAVESKSAEIASSLKILHQRINALGPLIKQARIRAVASRTEETKTSAASSAGAILDPITVDISEVRLSMDADHCHISTKFLFFACTAHCRNVQSFDYIWPKQGSDVRPHCNSSAYAVIRLYCYFTIKLWLTMSFVPLLLPPWLPVPLRLVYS